MLPGRDMKTRYLPTQFKKTGKAPFLSSQVQIQVFPPKNIPRQSRKTSISRSLSALSFLFPFLLSWRGCGRTSRVLPSTPHPTRLPRKLAVAQTHTSLMDWNSPLRTLDSSEPWVMHAVFTDGLFACLLLWTTVFFKVESVISLTCTPPLNLMLFWLKEYQDLTGICEEFGIKSV